MQFTRLVLPLTLAAAFASSSVFALNLKAADVHPEGYPNVVAMEHLGKKLEDQTKGAHTLKVFPNSVLGDEKSMIEQTQAGGIDILRTSLGPVGTVVPEVNVFNLPYVFRDEAHLRKVITGPIGDEILQKITASPAKLVALGWMTGGTRNLYTKKPVRNAAELKGMKIRMMGNPMFVETMNLMGGSGISMGYSELYSALQTGVVDGAENNEPSYISSNHYTVAKFFELTGHLMIPEVVVVSKATWDKLSKQDQQLLTKLVKEAQTEQFQLWDKRVAEDRAKMKAAGVKIIDKVDRDAFVKATQPIRDKYGAQYAELMKRIADVK